MLRARDHLTPTLLKKGLGGLLPGALAWEGAELDWAAGLGPEPARHRPPPPCSSCGRKRGAGCRRLCRHSVPSTQLLFSNLEVGFLFGDMKKRLRV